MDSKRLSDWAGAVQSVAVAAGIIVGGIWTLYTFDALGARERAKRDLARLTRDLEQQARISVDINVELKDYPGHPQSRLALITVTLSNHGTRDATLSLEEAALTSRRVELDENGEPSFTEWEKQAPTAGAAPALPLKSAVLAAGSEVELPFIVLVAKESVYLVNFTVPAGPAEIKEAQKAGSPAPFGVFENSRFFVVGTDAESQSCRRVAGN